MEVLLWYYAKGRPPDDDTYARGEVKALFRALSSLFCELVDDASTRLKFACGLRRLIPGVVPIDVPGDVVPGATTSADAPPPVRDELWLV